MVRSRKHMALRIGLVIATYASGTTAARAQQRPTPANLPTPIASAPAGTPRAPAPIAAAAAPLRNPFELPPRAIERSVVQPVFTGTLTATLVGAKQHLATIRLPNKELRVVAVGDSLRGWRISAIETGSVTAETRVDREVVHAVLRVEAQVRRLAVDSSSGPLLPPSTSGARAGSVTGVPADVPLLPPPTRPSGAVRPALPPGGTQ